MADSPHDEYKEISDNLQNNLFYEASTLEMMVSLMKSYKADMSKGYELSFTISGGVNSYKTRYIDPPSYPQLAVAATCEL